MDILIADADVPCVRFVAFLLEDAGYQTQKVYDGPTALQMIMHHRPSLVLLEAKLPTLSGFDLCREIRKLSDLPIIFLSSRTRVEDRVLGLQLGADDYIIKPFEPSELLIRIEVVLRRCQHHKILSLPQLNQAGLTLCPVEHRVQLDDQNIYLTPNEFQLLYYLMLNAGHILSIPQILNNVWGRSEELSEYSLVTTYINRLRTKLERDPAHPQRIVTCRNVGYKLQVLLA
jgi:DNA-binding response OmpR family regulator